MQLCRCPAVRHLWPMDEARNVFRVCAADVHMLLGDLAMETERFDSAAVDYREAITLMKANFEARFLSSYTFLRAGNSFPCLQLFCLVPIHWVAVVCGLRHQVRLQGFAVGSQREEPLSRLSKRRASQ